MCIPYCVCLLRHAPHTCVLAANQTAKAGAASAALARANRIQQQQQQPFPKGNVPVSKKTEPTDFVISDSDSDDVSEWPCPVGTRTVHGCVVCVLRC